MESLLATTVVAGTKTLIPLMGATAYARMKAETGRIEGTHYGKTITFGTPYATGDWDNFEKYPDDMHQLNKGLKPYFKTKPGALFASSSFKPEFLLDSNRTVKGTREEEEAKAKSINSIGECGSLQVSNDNVILKERFIRGDVVLNEWGARMGLWDHGRQKEYRRSQVTPHRLLISMRSTFSFATSLQKLYNLSDSEARRILGRAGEMRLRNDLQPGWKAEKDGGMKASQFASFTKFSSNVTAVVTQGSSYATRNGIEFQPRDYFWTVDFDTTGQSRYMLEDIAGLGNPDTLAKTNSFSTYRQQNNNFTSAKKHPSMKFATLQEAIADLEALGIDFEVQAEQSNAWPAQRSPMYANNFPYRGMTKKRLETPHVKRQKGGDAPRVLRSEWHPELVDSFSQKSDEYIFA